ncbi:putative enoyl-CoA hydratase 1, peroxisomal [Silene latifolia]|uniref:putative enoyl-CoA hydratase 1, peroxisomal n=1 Tax=Silene latifolia TaxID=37657 RepID=UPI003D77780A
MNPPSENIILVTRESTGIAHITLNRPNSLNALNKPMLTRLAQAFRSLDADDTVMVIILSGSGRAFCSGIDLTAAEEVFKGAVKDTEVDAIVQMERCRKPIVGAVSGFAATAGFELALGCDILVASIGTIFIDSHARLGIFPSWGLSQKLSQIIGPNKARELAFTGVPLTAEEGEKLGLVNHLVEAGELMTKAQEIAEAIIKNNKDLVLGYKAIINDGLKLSLGDGLALEKGIAHKHYQEMPSEKFRKLQEFIAGRKVGNSKL